MSTVLKATTIMTISMGVLFSFFAFAATKWIDGIETAIDGMQTADRRQAEKIVVMELIQNDQRERLVRIESKLDKILNRP